MDENLSKTSFSASSGTQGDEPDSPAALTKLNPSSTEPLRELKTLSQAVVLLDEWIVHAQMVRRERDLARWERDYLEAMLEDRARAWEF